MMRYLLLIAQAFLCNCAYGQVGCGSAAANQALLNSDPAFNYQRALATGIMNNPPAQAGISGAAGMLAGGIHYIPVVVHIINLGEPLGTTYNPSDQQVIDFIDVLNQGFSGTFPGYPSPATGGQDIGIQFVLAQRTPDCQPTNGIVRVDADTALSPNALSLYTAWGVGLMSPGSSFLGIPHDTLAAVSYWSNLDYYNIWLVRAIHSASGYAYYPLASVPTRQDGAVIDITSMSGPVQYPDLITHEIGHGFDLHHTFEGGCLNANCQTDGDMICDTDPHDSLAACDPNAINPCTGQPYGNVIYNYLSYSCNHMFTAGQKARMLSALTNLRPSLDASLGGLPPGLQLTPSVSIAASDTTICQNTPVTFTATSSFGGVNPSYQWKVNGINTGTNSPAFTAYFLNNNDIVSCVLTSGYSPNCLTSSTAISNEIQMAVSSTPAPFIFVSTNQNSPYCPGTAVTFDAIYNNAPNASLNWVLNGIQTGGTGASYTYTPVNNDTLICELTTSSSCISNPTMKSPAFVVPVTPYLYPAVSVFSDTTSFCSGDSVTIWTATSGTGAYFAQINWYINNSLVGVGIDPVTIEVPANASTLYATVTSYAPCPSPAVAYSDTITLTVSPNISPAVSVSASNNNFCPGGAASFSSTNINGGSNPVYDWFVNGVSAGSNTATFSYTPSDNDTVFCTLTSNNVCQSMPNDTSNSIMMHAIDPVSASAMLLQGANAGCEGDTLLLQSVYTNLDTNTVTGKTWLANGNIIGTADPLQYILAPGANNLELITEFQYPPVCLAADTLSYTLNSILAAIRTPTPVITSFSNHFSTDYPDGQNQWYAVGTGPLAGAVNQLFYPSFSGYYYAVANSNGCPSLSSDTLQFILPTSVFTADAIGGSFYPNPSRNGEFITPEKLIGKEAVVFNSLGSVVLKTTLRDHLVLKDFATGVYLLKLTGAASDNSYRLIIQ